MCCLTCGQSGQSAVQSDSTARLGCITIRHHARAVVTAAGVRLRTATFSGCARSGSTSGKSPYPKVVLAELVFEGTMRWTWGLLLDSLPINTVIGRAQHFRGFPAKKELLVARLKDFLCEGRGGGGSPGGWPGPQMPPRPFGGA